MQQQCTCEHVALLWYPPTGCRERGAQQKTPGHAARARTKEGKPKSQEEKVEQKTKPAEQTQTVDLPRTTGVPVEVIDRLMLVLELELELELVLVLVLVLVP